MADHPQSHRSVVKRRRATAIGRPRGPVTQPGGPSATTVGQQNLTAAERLVKKSGNRLSISKALERIEDARRIRQKRLKKGK